jgi:hypothetical protein
VRADDDFDWLAALAAADPATARSAARSWADVAAILRALASTLRHPRGGGGRCVEVAFGKADTMIYRDECGRRLRAMAPLVGAPR